VAGFGLVLFSVTWRFFRFVCRSIDRSIFK